MLGNNREGLVRMPSELSGERVPSASDSSSKTSRLDEEHLEHETPFRKIFEEGPIPIVLIGCDSLIKKANQAFCRMLGYEEAELLTLDYGKVTHPDDLPACRELVGRLRAGHIANFRTEKRYLSAQGEVIWADVFATFIRDSAGLPLYGLAMIVDITAHKHAEEKLRALTGRLLSLQDENRRKIARELHDSTGQDLAAVRLNLSRLSRATLPAELEPILPETLNLVDRMIAEIRTLSHLLHPPLLDELGLTSAVETYIDGFSMRSGIDVRFVSTSEMIRLAPELETTIFRIVQEALSNVHRHSGATECRVCLGLEDDRILLEIRDYGKGLPAETAAALKKRGAVPGVGLAGMQERARQLGGELSVESGSDGCAIKAAFPVLRR